MGLSLGERHYRLTNCIEEIVSLRDKFRESEKERISVLSIPFMQISDIVDKLWFHFGVAKANGAYWVFGGPIDCIVEQYTTGPWGQTINQQISMCMAEEDEFEYKEINVKDMLSITSLLQYNTKEAYAHDPRDAVFVYNILQLTESISYALKRYDDEFRHLLITFEIAISQIIGYCYTAMKDNNSFAKAYLLDQIFEVLYGPIGPYSKDQRDWVTNWLIEGNIHHHLLGAIELPLKEIVVIHKSLLSKYEEHKDISKIKNERLTVSLKLSGRRFQFPHTHKKLLGLCKINGSTKLQMQVAALCKQCEKANADFEVKSSYEPPSRIDIHFNWSSE